MKILHSKIIGDSNKHVIILHGFLGMGDNWKTHAKKISLEGFTVHLLDLRNHGRSFWDDDFDFAVHEDYESILLNAAADDLRKHNTAFVIYQKNKQPVFCLA